MSSPAEPQSASPPVVLTFSAADPSGGAGMQADILTLASMGCHPLSVLTAITVQDTLGVEALQPISAELAVLRTSLLPSLLLPSRSRVIPRAWLSLPGPEQSCSISSRSRRSTRTPAKTGCSGAKSST